LIHSAFIFFVQNPFNMAPTIVDKASINPPSVKREDVEGEKDALTEPIPLGIKLTGGIKLRDEGLTGRGVRVAVIDSGVDIDHPGFQGTVKKQMWFRDGTPLSIDDHGTHVAGTIHLMAPEAELYDYRVFGERGSWSVTEAISTAIFEAVYDGCDVINMSLGGRWPDPGIRSAVKFAHSNSVIVVCASGNSGDSDPLTNERG
jgi:subtilisin family serine protease